MYLYNITGNAYGEPVVLTKSTTASAGADESVVYTPSLSGEYYIVVKRAREDTGGGQFTLTSGPCSLTVNTVGSGSVTKNPDQTSYALGTLVQLTAVPDSGYSFAGWSGDLSGSTNPASITMNGDKTVTATFNLLPSGGAFDFGTASSPLETGYTQVSNSSVYSPATGYGWSSTIGLDTRDRGSPDDLKRDFVFSSTENTFDVDLADGDYQVTVTIGDQAYGHDLISVYAEDTLVIDSLTTAAGTFQQVTFYVTVSDQQLNLRILDNGGTDPNWVINAVTIEQGSPPSLPTSASFDFGTEGSPVAVGYDQVTESSFYSANVGYGWVTVNGLDSRDRGAPDDLRRDFVFDSSERTFNVDLENGDYLVTVTLGDQNFSHDDIALYAESILEFNNVTTLAGSFQELTFTVNVADEQLNLTILDNGGGDANWVLNAMTVVVAPPPPTSGAFDFGTTDSPVEAGYTQVSQLTLYSAVTGYGWSSTGELDSRDRSAPDDLKRDFVFSSSEHVFSIDLANGNYSVTVTVGDQDYMHDNIDVYAEGILEADNITTAAGSFQQVSFDVAVIDGQLNIGILDNGGVDPYWVVNAIASAIQ
jgi:uncharacterized repeat protein (TIGR02543 family)